MPPWLDHSSSAGWQESRAPAAGSEAAVRRRPGWGDGIGEWAGLETPSWEWLWRRRLERGSGCCQGSNATGQRVGTAWGKGGENSRGGDGNDPVTTLLFAPLTGFL